MTRKSAPKGRSKRSNNRSKKNKTIDEKKRGNDPEPPPGMGRIPDFFRPSTEESKHSARNRSPTHSSDEDLTDLTLGKRTHRNKKKGNRKRNKKKKSRTPTRTPHGRH
jgi:hypothetical protein